MRMNKKVVWGKMLTVYDCRQTCRNWRKRPKTITHSLSWSVLLTLFLTYCSPRFPVLGFRPLERRAKWKQGYVIRVSAENLGKKEKKNRF